MNKQMTNTLSNSKDTHVVLIGADGQVVKEELITIEVNENQEPVVSARELHKVLEVSKRFSAWWETQISYGFEEGQDYVGCTCRYAANQYGGEQELQDYAMKLDMAKELAMISKTEKGKEVRKYFIQVEKDFNSPEKIMARALRIAEQQLSNLKLENAQQQQIIGELQPKATYYDLVLQSTNLTPISIIAKDYGMSAKTLNSKLHQLGVQYKQCDTWLLYAKYQDKGYTQSKTQTYQKSDGTPGTKLHTQWTQKGRLFIYDLLKQNGILPMIERELM